MDITTWEDHAKKHGTVADLLGMKRDTNAEGSSRDVREIIFKEVFPGVDLVPSHLDLFTVDLDLAGITARETRLRRSLQPVADDYDLIVCDCPPNLTIPTQNALALCSHYIVPVSPDYLSGIGVGLLLQRIERFCADMERNLHLAGIVISRVGRPATHRQETVAALRETFAENVLQGELAERVVVSKAAAAHKPIYEMADREAIGEFQSISRQISERMEDSNP